MPRMIECAGACCNITAPAWRAWPLVSVVCFALNVRLQLQVQQLQQLVDQLQLRVDARPGIAPLNFMRHQPSSTSRDSAVDATRTVQLRGRTDAPSAPAATSTAAAAAAAPAKPGNVLTAEGIGNDLARSLAAVWEHVEVLKTRVATRKEDRQTSAGSADM
jgi:hypothetical protein